MVKMRSTEESEGSRMLSEPSAGGKLKPTHGTNLIEETLTVVSLQQMIASTTL
jgi:hypothetical protein